MAYLPARIAPLLTLLILATACGPEPHQPAAEQSNFAVEPAPIPDPGLLLTIMIDLGQEMSSLSDALWRDDLATVAAAAGAIAEHPRVSASERERVQTLLGDDFPDFVKGDQRVHQTAVRLAERAAAGDMSGTIQELAELQAACVSCHDTFRDALRSPNP